MPRIPVLPRPLRAACLVAVLATLAGGGMAHADDETSRASETVGVTAGQPPRQSAPDFLFGRPRTVVGVSGGWLVASERGGIFDFTRGLLTINDGDFDTGAFRVHIGRSLSPRLDVMVEVGFSRATITSEYRDFVDVDGLEIVQTTELTQGPFGGSLRFWLRPRGREVGRFAWVPHRIAPYVGAGGGTQWYHFMQTGDFVDFVDLSIFTERLDSSGWTPSGHIFGGTSVNLTRHLFLGVEARYIWANTPLSADFVGFENIDLNGLRITIGIEYLF